MKITPWEDALKLITNKENTNVTFFVIFTRHQDWNCMVMSEEYKIVRKHFQNEKSVQFLHVDIDESKLLTEINSPFRVLQAPTFLIIFNNKVKRSGSGYYPREIMIDFIEENLD
ncbi:hypothetical protein KQ878_03355 [Mycoplasma zalophidermidis]|uniref:Thioredoxin n=1 Tax=Mycoplasma zalophidermidis TaxID=398174 RepID=A0ABS6DTY7_9MOLU|nr:hypothetical protein [Mycoplasma zalophidermidis]MBU4689700.1 hypothetical protein [Mycoplasma zalophidermidis]MBU4693904.1 hypothetical protein [Mycoplasma zalophidermidis]